MMISMYLLWTMSVGFSSATLLLGQLGLLAQLKLAPKRPLTYSLALAPILAMFFPILLLHGLQIFHIPFTTTHLYIPWILLGGCCIFFARSAFKQLWQKYRDLWKISSSWWKVWWVLLPLSLWSLLLRVFYAPIWQGDGMSFWAMRALGFQQAQGISLAPSLLDSLQTWNGYPLLHSLGMLVHLLALPTVPAAFSCKLFDGYSLLGLIFSGILLLQVLQCSWRESVVGGFLLCFCQRGFPAAMISGYADLEVAYFSLLALALGLGSVGWGPNKRNIIDSRLLLCCGLVLGILSTVKAEGIYRAFFLLLGLVWYVGKEGKRGKMLLFLILASLGPILLDRLHHPLQQISSQYLDHLNLSLPRIFSRIPLVLQATYYFLFPTQEVFYKWSWPWTIAMAVFGLFSGRGQGQGQRPMLKIYVLLILLIFLNFSFNIAPGLIVENVVDPRLDDPQIWAPMVLARIHLHWAPFLNAIAVLSGITFYRQGLFAKRAIG